MWVSRNLALMICSWDDFTNPKLSISYWYFREIFWLFDKNKWLFWHFLVCFDSQTKIHLEAIKYSSKFGKKKSGFGGNKIRETIWWADHKMTNKCYLEDQGWEFYFLLLSNILCSSIWKSYFIEVIESQKII